MSDLIGMSARTMTEAVTAGELSPEEIVDATLQAIAERDPHLNAFVHVAADEARGAARRLGERLRNGEDCGPLAGVPTAMKDLFNDYPGWSSTFGGAIPPGAMVASNATTYPRRMEQTGAVMVGATNSPVLGFRGTCDNAVFGPTSNPFDLTRNSGGSSGGSTAAVAAGILPIADATDGGGSIRIPSAWSGTFGFQPTFGRVPMPMRPNAFGATAPFVFEGPVTRTVDDAALALTALAGRDRNDPFSLSDTVDWEGSLRGSIAGLRIGYTPDFGVFAVDKRIVAAVEESLAAFERQGAIIVPLATRMPFEQHELSDLWSRMISLGNLAVATALTEAGLNPQLPPPVIEWNEIIRDMGPLDLQRDQIMRAAVLDTMEGIFDEVDLIVSPTVGALAVANDPVRGATLGPSEIEGVAVNPVTGWCLTYLTNFTGHPAASLPGGLIDGLPYGIQLIGPRFGDALLLGACARFEEAQPWQWIYDRLAPELSA